MYLSCVLVHPRAEQSVVNGDGVLANMQPRTSSAPSRYAACAPPMVPGACGRTLLHPIDGVGIFGWLLDACGWNRHVVERMLGFSGRRTALLSLEQ